MASDFIYILSSLPMLSFDGEGAVDYEAFLDSCKNLVSAKEYGTLASLALHGNADTAMEPPVLATWNHWCKVMGGVIATWRVQRRKLDNASSLRMERGAFPDDVRKLEAILLMKGIQEKQDAWEQLQWNRLEDLASQEYFNFSALAVYALKLLLLETRRKRSIEAGKNVFEAMVAKHLDEAAANRISVEE